jgi:hypothetical protein
MCPIFLCSVRPPFATIEVLRWAVFSDWIVPNIGVL